MECVWYELPSFDEGIITFNRLELTNKRRREEHVLDFLSAQRVPVDGYVCYVVEIT